MALLTQALGVLLMSGPILDKGRRTIVRAARNWWLRRIIGCGCRWTARYGFVVRYGCKRHGGDLL